MLDGLVSQPPGRRCVAADAGHTPHRPRMGRREKEQYVYDRAAHRRSVQLPQPSVNHAIELYRLVRVPCIEYARRSHGSVTTSNFVMVEQKRKGVANTMTYVEAALTVLETCGRPLTTREILDEATQRGLLTPTGKTPLASMSAELYTLSRARSGKPLIRLSEPGGARARRGTVRWTLRDAPSSGTA